jgi:8-oxo-dGTP pyrophosphatase MutT (NUDIX family)
MSELTDLNTGLPDDGPGADCSVADMLREEFEAIHGPLPEGFRDAGSLDDRLAALYSQIHALPPEVGRSALCLSGGGIRSAAFAFGALRALAGAGVLQRFHYLSTVSGGGYIGAWLTAWIHRHFKQQSGNKSLPPRAHRLGEVSTWLAGAGDGRLGGSRPPEPDQVAHVRRFTNYLSPSMGAFALDTWTLGAVYLRNLLLNWLVLLPLLVAALVVPRIVAEVFVAAGPASDLADARFLSMVAPAALALLTWLALIGRTVLRPHSADAGRAESWSRWEGGSLMAATLWALLAGLVLYGPELLAKAPSVLTAAGGVTGLATILLKKLGDRPRMSGEEANRPARLVRLATNGAALLTIALVLVLLAVVGQALVDAGQSAWHGLPAPVISLGLALGLLGASALASMLVDINEFSLHALYRNRLVRAFLRASRHDAEAVRDSAFDEKDDLPLTMLWPRGKATQKRGEAPHLFHVINATLNDLGGSRPEWNERKGVSFTFSPLHVGAHIVGRSGPGSVPGGYRRLDRDAPEKKAIRLGTAMSVSGAAASPNMGYHSSAPVTFLLALFNVRLGWWMHAPWREGELTTLRRRPSAVWRAWLAELFGGTRFTSRVVNISDGGHFDNLGLYEMVRRRCRHIVVLDGGQDSDRTFASLGEAIRKIRVDFGIPITLAGLDIQGGDGGSGHAWHGTIHYSRIDSDPDGAPAPDGELIYFRPVVSGDEPVDVQAYQRLNPEFPHQSTADQWFSESQFESYRALGEHAIQHILDYYDASKGPSLRRVGAAGYGLSPGQFCHRVAESLALMRRHKQASSHAGGVVYRRSDTGIEFLLVRSTDRRHRILPKGVIEPWEDAVAAAVREVREEAGLQLPPARSLGVASFETESGKKVTTTYFLMEHLGSDRDREKPLEGYREPEWFTVEAARAAGASIPGDVVEILERAQASIPSHAGGVVYRGLDSDPEFLLVWSSDGTCRVLPKGHIEPEESSAVAANREVAEEAGLELQAGDSLGLIPVARETGGILVEYFLMDADAAPELTAGADRDPDTQAGQAAKAEPARQPTWYTLEDAKADQQVPKDVLSVLQRAAQLLEHGGTDPD